MFLSFFMRHAFHRKKYINITITEANDLPKDSKPIIKLDPACIPKYRNQLAKPPVFEPVIVHGMDEYGECRKEHLYHIDISEFNQQVLPKGFPKTKVWGYGGLIRESKNKVRYYRSSPGSTFEAVQGIPVKVNWICKLNSNHPFPVDPTLHWANPNDMSMEPPMPWPSFPPGFHKAQKPVPVVTHLHGGETSSLSDGYPEAWFTYDGQHGPEYITSLYTYPNEQEPTTLWYHDHAMGITRLNVYAGLAGFYLLRDSNDFCDITDKLILPEGDKEIPIVIQDRTFLTNGSLFYDNVGVNPEIHPYWVPEFFGDVIMVNGKVWPNLKVDRCRYRFRALNGSNARFYNLKLSNGMKFIQIGSDGGFLSAPVTLTSLLLAPAERADILIDFSEINPGTKIILLNDANVPYPDGDSPDPDTVGQIMQFTIPENAPAPVKTPKLPECLNHIPDLHPDVRRVFTLNELAGPNGPTEVLLNGLKWSYPVTEKPVVGSTQEWEIVNLTMDTHPIHLHLVQFRLFNRQDMNVEDYQKDWESCNGTPPLLHPPKVVPVEPYLIGCPIPPEENEAGWKDTVRMNPGQVTRIRIRFAPQNAPQCWVRPGDNLFPFDPSIGPGYVWHCHILDHEDNEMMRPYKVE
jgi:spore coat protein A, manganese oxidase